MDSYNYILLDSVNIIQTIFILWKVQKILSQNFLKEFFQKQNG